MQYLITLVLVAIMLLPIYFTYKRYQTGKKIKASLIINIASFFVCCVIASMLGIIDAGTASAAQLPAGETASAASNGMGLMAAALVTGASCIGAGIAVAAAASAALGAISENDKTFGKALIFVALAEGVALYGVLISFQILSKI